MNPQLVAMLILLVSSLKVEASAVQAVAPIGNPGCRVSCGNISVPFPFGIGRNCFLDSRYEIECKTPPNSSGSAKPFLSKFDIEVLEIVLDAEDLNANQTLTVQIPPLKVCTADLQRKRVSSIDLRGSPYNFSTDGHAFLMEGCTGSAIFVNQSESEQIMARCSTVCRTSNNTAISRNKCYGVECCQTQLPSSSSDRDLSLLQSSPLQFFHIDFYGQSSNNGQNCMAATLIKSDHVSQYIGMLSSHPLTVPTVLYWSWLNRHWPQYNPDEAICTRDEGTNITSCKCKDNRFGNPYISNGCQVPEECRGCRMSCNRDGNSYKCTKDFTSWIIIFGIIEFGFVVGLILILIFGCRWLYRFIKRRTKISRRVEFFKMKLQQHQSSSEGVAERTKLFTNKELDIATNHFNEDRVLGKGGQGTVYKGMLVDGSIVAVKKSKRMDEIQIEQFINEIVILSQINHRNVVKVLGCCLETEVPLLVYEFISNGTLYQRIHGHPDAEFPLSWPTRLRIAADSAGAVAYLHSSSSMPIYHRDIKSANILLDDKYRAKVSDFGSSKTIEIDQTHLTTLVQGTIGYLDPEYFGSYTFTEKSDVYSFGVVLLELLTSKKPVYKDEMMEQKSLVTEFLFQMKDVGLSEMLDPEVVKEAKEEQVMAMIDLAKHCLNESGRFRPTMKEVAITLEMIIKLSPTENSNQDQPAFPDEGFSGIVMSETSVAEFMSSPIVSGAAGPVYIDVPPLLPNTI